MRLSQTMAVRAADGLALGDLMSAWHEAEAGVASWFAPRLILLCPQRVVGDLGADWTALLWWLKPD
jgi:hypothetical protein